MKPLLRRTIRTIEAFLASGTLPSPEMKEILDLRDNLIDAHDSEYSESAQWVRKVLEPFAHSQTDPHLLDMLDELAPFMAIHLGIRGPTALEIYTMSFTDAMTWCIQRPTVMMAIRQVLARGHSSDDPAEKEFFKDAYTQFLESVATSAYQSFRTLVQNGVDDDDEIGAHMDRIDQIVHDADYRDVVERTIVQLAMGFEKMSEA